MKDHLVDRRRLAAKFDNEAFELDDAKPSALLGREAIGRLVIRLQRKASLTIQRDAMGDRATFVVANASRTKRGVGAVAGRKAGEDNILHRRLQWRRQADDVAVAIGQKGDGKPVRQQAVR